MKQSRPFYREDKKCWYARIDGRRVSLGVKNQSDEKAALAQWHRLNAFQEPQKAKKEVPTVARVVTLFLMDAESRVSPLTYRHYAKFLSRFSDQFPYRQCDKLTPAQVEAWARKPTWGQQTRHDALNVVRVCFRWAERAGLLERTPIQGLKMPATRSRGAEAVISDETYQRMLANTAGDFRQLVRFMLATACRPSEASGLTAAMIDFDNSCIVLKHHKTADATGRVRVIYLNAEALEVIREQAKAYPTGYLFPGANGGRMSPSALGQRFQYLSKKLGVRVFAYQSRHTRITNWLLSGMPDTIASSLAGHASTSMIHRHYSHVNERSNELREALSRFG